MTKMVIRTTEISDGPMVVATIQEQSAFQLDSSAHIFIHNVTLIQLIKLRRSMLIKPFQEELQCTHLLHNKKSH